MYIELKNVSKKIKGIDILDDVSLRMESGKIYGFRGKNGSGKTMLMRAIAGLIKVTGTVDINGSILGKDEMFPPSIGILIENPSFISNYTGFENLKTLASIRERIDDNSGIAGNMQRLAGAGDGGVQQLTREYAGITRGQLQVHAIKLAALRLVHGHGKRRLVCGQAGRVKTAHTVAAGKPDTSMARCIGQTDAHIAIE